MKNVLALLTALILGANSFAQVLTTDTVQIGAPGSSANKEIKFGAGRGAKPSLRYNQTTSKFEFSNDASIFKSFGSGSGSGSGINLLQNPGFEDGVLANWTSSGGTYAAVTTGANLLYELISASFTASAGSQFFESSSIAVPNILYGTNCMVKVTYKGGDSNLYLSVFDGSSVELIPSTARATLNSQSGVKDAKVYFTCPSSGSIKLRVASTAAAAVAYFDQTHLGQADFNGASNKTAVSAYTPTFTGLGTVSGNQAFFIRDGDMLEVWGGVTVGTPTATQISVSLPTALGSLVIDSSKVHSTQRQLIGTATRAVVSVTNQLPSTAAGAFAMTVDIPTSSTVVYLSTNTNTTANHYAIAVGSTVFTAGDFFQYRFRVPIVGWGNIEQAINSKCLNDIACENYFTAKVDNSGAVSDENLDWLSGSCTNANPRVCTFNAGIFTSTPNCYAQSSTVSGSPRETTILAQSSTSISVRTYADGVTPLQDSFTLICAKHGADFKAKQTIQGFFSNTVTSTYSFPRVEAVSVATICSTSPCTIARQSGAVTSIVRTTTGEYTINFAAGTFASPPICTCSNTNGSGNGFYCPVRNPANTATQVFLVSINTATAAADSVFDVICVGPR